MSERQRAAGILLHPTSLPGRFAVGDLGPAAHAFLDWLAAAGMSRWQVLPTGPTGLGDSPYTALSTFAGNPLLVSPEALRQDGLVQDEDLNAGDLPPSGSVDFVAARNFKQRLHRRAWEAFGAQPPAEVARAWEAFRAGDWGALGLEAGSRSRVETLAAGAAGGGESEATVVAGTIAPQVPAASTSPTPPRLHPPSRVFESSSLSLSLSSTEESLPSSSSLEREGLEEWALYCALKERAGGLPWFSWDEELRARRAGAVARARREIAGEVEFRLFEQFLFFRQWGALRAAAAARGIGLIGDLPIYVAADSADVWARPELYDVSRNGKLRAVAGVPPDYFSTSGQRWGNPLYRWERHSARGFDWWVARVRHQLRLVDQLRLDHFRGFVAYWEIPARAKTAEKGRWREGPGAALFAALSAELGALPLIAEDLGDVDEPVHGLRRRLGLPGTRVLQFAFDDEDSLHAPHRHTPDSAVYTGTHDNDTCRGWIASASEGARHRALTYLGCDAQGFPAAMVRAALTSVADLAIVPIQDILTLESSARMNRPGEPGGNWSFRVRADQVPGDLPGRLRDLSGAAARCPSDPHGPAPEATAPPSPGA